MPTTASAITVPILATAFSTPLPRYLELSPSRSSSASKAPVDAPLGTVPLAIVPSASVTSASTAGFPLESRISLPTTAAIFKRFIIFPCSSAYKSAVKLIPALSLISELFCHGCYVIQFSVKLYLHYFNVRIESPA